MAQPELFTMRMKKATRELHAISDSLVNAKLVFALSDHSVWADGLLIFYEIFRFLEDAMLRLKDKNLGKLNIPGMERTEAFEADLKYYLGLDWKRKYVIRESVAKYLSYLQHLFNTDPDMLTVYVYHLYMGLLSGGQLLMKKRNIRNKLFDSNSERFGEAVTNFGEHKITELKQSIKDAMNSIAETMDEETKQQLIEESRKLFRLNNSIIRTVRGTNRVLLQKLASFSLFVFALGALYIYFFYDL